MVTIPTTVFGLMALIITTLAGVVVYQQRKLELSYKRVEDLYREKSELQDKRLADANLVRDRYDTVMGKFSESFNLFVAKLDGERKR